MKNPLLWIVIVLVVVGIGAYALSMKPASDAMVPVDTGTSAATTPSDTTGDTNGTGAPVSAFTVHHTANGFSPSTLSVPAGTTVTFVDDTGSGMWVASAEHPTHTEYDGTSRTEHCAAGASPSFDQCGKTSSYSFTFTKVGTWNYHNHVNASEHGSIVVTQ